METLLSTEINKIISESLDRSMSYAEYRALMGELVAIRSTTGADKSEAMADYTALNEQRMKRWDKTIKLGEAEQERLLKFEKQQIWLLITESWCGDAAHVVPAINKVAQANPVIELRLVLRDDHEALMQQFLTNGGKAIPKLIILDAQTQEVKATFGPRPQAATQLVADFKEKHGMLTPEFKESLQVWYNKDKGQSTISDLLDILNL